MKLNMNIKEDKVKEHLFIRGVNSFNKRRFYEAHEFWEDLWTEYRLDDDKLVQGFIQLSVGSFHITNSNKRGAINLLNKSLNKFKLFEGVQRRIEVLSITANINNILSHLNYIDKVEDFNWKIVKEIRCIDE